MSRIQPATSLLAAAIAAASMTPASSQTAKGARVVTAVAVGEQGKIQESNEWTVGIAGGLLEGTNIRFASEEAPPPRQNRRIASSTSFAACWISLRRRDKRWMRRVG